MMYSFFRSLFGFLFLSLCAFPFSVHASEAVDVYLFYSDGCPHCNDEKAFLNTLHSDEFTLHAYGVDTQDGQDRLAAVSQIAPHPVQGVPLTVIGETFIAGYMSDETTGVQIRDAMDRLRNGEEENLLHTFFAGEDVSGILARIEADMSGGVCEIGGDVCEISQEQTQAYEIDLLFFGKTDIRSFSLPAMTVVIAFLDGFNPCAMWVLIFLISVLMGMENRRRMWLLGSAFIFASGFVYFLLLSAWLNVFMFLGFLRWIQIAIGALALTTAGWYLYDGYTNKHGECTISSPMKTKKTRDRVRAVVHHENIFFALIGIVVVAFAVNILEALCSAGLPAVYTQVLTMSALPVWQYYAYLVLYILVFMIDDLFIFSVAMLTLKYANINTKYARWSHLIGGFILMIIGVLLLFQPSLLLLG